MFQFFKVVASSVASAKPGKLRLFADESGLFKVKNDLGVSRTLGNAVRNVVLFSSSSLTDIYRVTTDDFTFDFEVVNGRGVANIEATANAGQPDSSDTYTVRYNDGTTSTFVVRNGRDGVDGLVASVNGFSQTNIVLTAADVGAISVAEKGAANGVATLGSDFKIPAAQLPAYVDDVLEFSSLAAFPVTGESGKIYVAVDTGFAYRWSGSMYIEISAAPVTQVNGNVGNVTLTTSDITEGTNQYFTAQRVRDTVLTGLSLATNAAITAADSVLSAFGRLQKQITDHFAAVDPHPQYATEAESTTIANNAVAAHAGLADPHPQYITADELPPIPAEKLSAKISALFTSVANNATVQTVVTLNIPANYMTAGFCLDLDMEGTQSQSAAATNVVVSIAVNGTQIVSAAAAGGTAAQTNRSLRAKGGLMWNGSVFLGNITTGISGVLPVGSANVAGVAAAGNAAHAITFRVQTSTANAANIIRAISAVIKEI